TAVDRGLSETITQDEISFDGAKVGRPYLIKVTYHPNWKVEGADKIFLVSPAFMLVYPTEGHVRLYYSRTWPDDLVIIFTIAGLCLAVLLRKRRASFGRSTSRQNDILWALTWTLVVGVAIYLGWSNFNVRQNVPYSLLQEGVRLKDHDKWDEAE